MTIKFETEKTYTGYIKGLFHDSELFTHKVFRRTPKSVWVEYKDPGNPYGDEVRRKCKIVEVEGVETFSVVHYGNTVTVSAENVIYQNLKEYSQTVYSTDASVLPIEVAHSAIVRPIGYATPSGEHYWTKRYIIDGKLYCDESLFLEF